MTQTTCIYLQRGGNPTCKDRVYATTMGAYAADILAEGKSNRVGVTIDGALHQVFENKFKEYDRTWKDQVMRNGAVCRLRFAIDRTKASHTIVLHAFDAGQMVQRIVLDWGGLQPSYIGPES